MEIVHCIVNNLGGITTLVQNLILYDQSNTVEQKIFTLNIKDNIQEPAFFGEELEKKTLFFNLNPKDNWYNIYGSIAKILSEDAGVLISNDQYDLIMLQAFNIPKKVVQLVHDPYNVELSKKFHNVIDGFIAHNMDIYIQLLILFPDRRVDVHFQPYGIPFNENSINSKYKNEILKLLFLGRHDTEKGIYDLFEINARLLKKDIEVEWYILGKGPETEKLKGQWKGQKNVTFILAKDNDEVLNYAFGSDIFVFPTKFEGSPVAMLEAMSMGCVPVVTDLPGGIAETIENGINGFKCKLEEIDEFVNAIEKLNKNRDLLYAMQSKCHSTVVRNFNVYKSTSLYIDIFKKYAISTGAPRHHHVSLKIGSRLDQKWLPSFLTLLLRKTNPFKHSKLQ